jgi:hypothetical protein
MTVDDNHDDDDGDDDDDDDDDDIGAFENKGVIECDC